MKSPAKLKKALSIALILIFAAMLIYFLHIRKTSRTVDFAGTVQSVSLNDGGETVITAVNTFDITYTVTADSSTSVKSVFSDEKVTIEDLEAGDYISGKYRLFSKTHAKSVKISKTSDG